MRQRITFVHKPEDAIDPKSLKVSNNSISIEALNAAREDKVTFSHDDLPQDIQRVLKQSHELHIRYVRSSYHEPVSPLLSQQSPGLHVYYSPQRMAKADDHLCRLLNKVFQPLDLASCQTPEKSFTRLPSQRFQHSTAFEYYLPQSSIHPHAIFDHLVNFLCPKHNPECFRRVAILREASSLDIDYDAISHSLNLVASYPQQVWQTTLVTKDTDRLEVGILSPEKATEPEELSLGGFLTVIGEDDKPKPTLFSFPARHHPHSATYSSSFLTPTGLHPTMRIEINSAARPKHSEEKSCTLHTYLTLPKTIFADKYQLEDPMFMKSKNLSTVQYISSPVDLEAPSYTTDLWGSSLLLSLAPPPADTETYSAEIPLHLRYLPLSTDTTGYRDISVPDPILFWACVADEGSKFTVNPFDRVNLGYDGLFGPRTMFYHLNPTAPKSEPLGIVESGNSLKVENGLSGKDDGGYMKITVPVLDTKYAGLVEAGTAAVVLFGFGWILLRLWLVWKKEGHGSGRIGKRSEKKTE